MPKGRPVAEGRWPWQSLGAKKEPGFIVSFSNRQYRGLSGPDVLWSQMSIPCPSEERPGSFLTLFKISLSTPESVNPENSTENITNMCMAVQGSSFFSTISQAPRIQVKGHRSQPMEDVTDVPTTHIRGGPWLRPVAQ